MTPNQLYALPHIIEITGDFLRLDMFIAEVDFNQLDKVDVIEGLVIRYYAHHCSDGERVWNLFSVWFNGKPFMVCQSAGRGGCDHADNFVTDREVYSQLVKYLVSLYPVKPEDTVDPDKDLPEMTEFYGDQLENFYDPSLHTPKYKVGDIVRVKVLENHLRDRYAMNPAYVETRVHIDDVHPYCSLKTYGGTQMDRRVGTLPPKKGSVAENLIQSGMSITRWSSDLYIIEDPGNGSLGAQFNDQDIVE